MRTTRPSKDYWTNAPVGRSNFYLSARNGMRDGRSGVQFEMTGPDAKAHFRLIEQRHRELVEARLGQFGPIEWRLMPNAKVSRSGSSERERQPTGRRGPRSTNGWPMPSRRCDPCSRRSSSR
ncbi:MAG: DUF4268 domain-containing protein [Acidimicrobiia bacterium]|nr:DUF4268 domain-containing protein [Acidimicrobiia bacterium]